MANTLLTNLGEITSNFYLNDLTVYVQNTSATGGYDATEWAILGYTDPEKTINLIQEEYTREDKIPRVPTYNKTIRKGLEVTTGLSNVNLSVMGMVMRGTYQDLGTATGERIAVGTDEAALEYRAIRISGKRDDEKTFSITIPKCKISYSGEFVMGGEEEAKQPLMFKAFYNPSANATANLYYVNAWATGISATADVPPGYN